MTLPDAGGRLVRPGLAGVGRGRVMRHGPARTRPGSCTAPRAAAVRGQRHAGLLTMGCWRRGPVSGRPGRGPGHHDRRPRRGAAPAHPPAAPSRPSATAATPDGTAAAPAEAAAPPGRRAAPLPERGRGRLRPTERARGRGGQLHPGAVQRPHPRHPRRRAAIDALAAPAARARSRRPSTRRWPPSARAWACTARPATAPRCCCGRTPVGWRVEDYGDGRPRSPSG
jgi:hypothetical protein